MDPLLGAGRSSPDGDDFAIGGDAVEVLTMPRIHLCHSRFCSVPHHVPNDVQHLESLPFALDDRTTGAPYNGPLALTREDLRSEQPALGSDPRGL